MLQLPNFRWEIITIQRGIKSLVAHTEDEGLFSPVGKKGWNLMKDCEGNNVTTRTDFKLSQVPFINYVFCKQF